MLCESCYLHFLSQAQIYIFWDMNVLIFIWYKCNCTQNFIKKIVYSIVLCYGALIPLKCALFWCSCLLLMHFGTACFGLGCFLLFEIWEPARIAVILIHIKCPLVQMQMPPDAKSSSVWNAFCFWEIRSSTCFCYPYSFKVPPDAKTALALPALFLVWVLLWHLRFRDIGIWVLRCFLKIT